MAKRKKDDLVPPKPNLWDYFYKANKAALSVVPPLAEFYEMVVAPPFKKGQLNLCNLLQRSVKNMK